MLVPTSATIGAPSPNTSGIRRYSSRAPVPYPATASGPPVVPTSAVVIATVIVVCSVLTAATSPTRRMSANNAHRSRPSPSRTTHRPDSTYHPSTTAISSDVPTTAAPPPAIPIAGTGPQPKISNGDNGTSSTTPRQMVNDGTSMLPVPRITLASAFASQTSVMPAKTTSE